jgi:hypothetical protein
MAIINQNQAFFQSFNRIPFYKSSGSSTNRSFSTPFMTGLTTAPNPFGFNATDASGAAVDGTTSNQGGLFPFVNPASGNTYLTNVVLSTLYNISAVVFFDLLWYSTSINVTTTTAQTVNSVAYGARDSDGTTAGDGVIASLIITTALGNTSTAIPSISYTNQNGVSGRTGTVFSYTGAAGAVGIPSSGQVNSSFPFSLQIGDTGVQSIQSITLGTSLVSGSVSLLMYREIAFIGMPNGTSPGGNSLTADWAFLGFPQLYNGTAMTFYTIQTGNNSNPINGEISLGNG